VVFLRLKKKKVLLEDEWMSGVEVDRLTLNPGRAGLVVVWEESPNFQKSGGLVLALGLYVKYSNALELPMLSILV